nr:hypothetical protein [Halogranum amylolyticum]
MLPSDRPVGEVEREQRQFGRDVDRLISDDWTTLEQAGLALGTGPLRLSRLGVQPKDRGLSERDDHIVAKSK